VDSAGATLPLANVVLEGDRILEAAASSGVTVRLLGGVAVARHVHRALPDELGRPYGDIDIITSGREGRKVRDILAALDYEPNRPFNSLHGERRLQFMDVRNERHLDVLLDVFEMCHRLDDLPLSAHPATLSPADLLLTKLQVVQVTEKDLIDACTLLLQHDVARASGDVIDLGRLSDVTRRDWGWYTTATDNLARLADFADGRLTSQADREDVAGKVRLIAAELVSAPKTLKWKARATVGRRVPWYVLPDEPNIA
jgi:hypothetical protein